MGSGAEQFCDWAGTGRFVIHQGLAGPTLALQSFDNFDMQVVEVFRFVADQQPFLQASKYWDCSYNAEGGGGDPKL